MEKKLNIEGYLNMIDSKFSGANGYDYSEVTNQVAYSAAEGDARMASPQYQAQQRTMPAPYQVSLYNSTGGTLTGIIFGYNQYQNTTNYGSAVGITVTALTGISYIQLLSQSASQPFETSKIKVTSTNTAQVGQTFTITATDASGITCTEPIIAEMYISPDQYRNDMVEIPRNIILDGNTVISTPVLTGATVTFTFFPAEKVNTSRVLGGSNLSPIKMYSAAPQPIQTVQLATRV